MEDIIRVNKKEESSERGNKVMPKLPLNKKAGKILVVLVLVALAVLAGWLYKQNRDLKANPTAAQQDKNKATEALLNDLYARMKENIIHLEDQSRLGTFEDMVVASRIHLKNASVLPVLNNNTQQLDIEKNLASYIDQLKEPEYTSLNDEIKNLKLSLKNQGLKWNDLLKSPLNLYKSLLLIITLIPALIGLVFHGLPIMGGYNFTKSKVRQTEFKASILMVSTLVLTLIMYVILILVIIFTSISWIWLPIILVSGLSLRLCYTIYTQTIFKGKKGLQDSQKIAQNLVNSLNQKS